MLIKKTSQYIEGGASLSNVYGTSDSNGYTQEYINGLYTYIVGEKRVGTWIDGKPLYRRVLTKAINNASNIIVDTLTDIDEIMISGESFISTESSTNKYNAGVYQYENASNWTKVFTNLVKSTHTCTVNWIGSTTTANLIVVVLYTKASD